MMEIPLSIVILTKNEEQNLPECLDSVKWCRDVHVIDSGSTDKTVGIARERGVQCKYYPFESFAKQRNWALDNCNFKYEWVFFLDADERSTEGFKNSLSMALKNSNGSIAGFYCCSKMILNGRWLKRSTQFPNWQFRILRLSRARFVDYGHGQKEYQVKGKIEYIKEPYLHYPFTKGWEEWWGRHKRYAEEEAIIRLQDNIHWKDIVSPNGSIRNRALRPLVSRIPGWPLGRFCIEYFLRLGFLEGLPGFIYTKNMALYEFMVQFSMIKRIIKRMINT